MRALNVLLALLFPVVLFLALFEGGLRLLGKGPVESGLRFDEVVGWAKKSDTSYTRSGPGYTATIELNELGLRDDPMDSAAKPEGTTRVLVLGDSFTLGYTVEREHLFVDLLEGWCEAEGRAVDVVNAGTQAWSTDQSVAWLGEHGLAFQPDVVVLAPYDNDLYFNGQTSYHEYQKPRYDAEGFLESDTLADPFADGEPLSKSWAIAKLFERSTPGDSFTPPGGEVPLPLDFAPLFPGIDPAILGDCLERSRGTLIAAQRICNQLGAELLVAPIPSHSAIEVDMAQRMSEYFRVPASSWQPARPVELVVSWCNELGIEVADPTEVLVAATSIVRDDAGGIDYAASERCYLDFFENGAEWHFNEHGNEVYGRFLHAELTSRDGWLPAGEREIELIAANAGIGSEEAGLPFWMMLFAALWISLSCCYISFYRDEAAPLAAVKIFCLLAVIFATFMGIKALISMLSAINPNAGLAMGAVFVIGVLGFVGYKLGNRLATIAELFKAFTLRGHWYLMPVVVILLTIGSLLVVAASSPLVAPFIYTLF